MAFNNLRQIDDDMYYNDAYNRCIENPQVYDDDGLDLTSL